MHYLITGCAGFIGYHLCKKILEKNKIAKIYGVDNINDYYDINIKLERLKDLRKYKNFEFKKIDIKNYEKINSYLKSKKIVYLVNLAAQAGVRYSIKNPRAYLDSNIIGFFNLLEISKKKKIKHFLYASTSSVYGDSEDFPLSEKTTTDSPLSIYAATKKSNEILAYAYSNLFKIPLSGMRFFTVYGPFGRPDMALFKFTKAILENKKIKVFNYGNHQRDFTYIDDVIEGIIGLLSKPSKKKVSHQIFNIGSNNPQKLMQFIKIIEKNLDKKAKIEFKPLQQADVHKTHASIKKIKNYSGYHPKTNLEKGIKSFVEWYKDYYK